LIELRRIDRFLAPTRERLEAIGSLETPRLDLRPERAAAGQESFGGPAKRAEGPCPFENICSSTALGCCGGILVG
jgi:hypothetical protein